jgi:2,4-dienoyl-CoA reductase-like NADH-dependent reductase (Old Yellow Enzyme family)
MDIFSSFTLPNGQVLSNHIVKAAMEENLSNGELLPDEQLWNLYGKWSEGELGAMITGNVMVDHRAMTGPGGVALEKDSDLTPFRIWAERAKQNGSKIWMQINHPGRQILRKLGGEVWSPSAVAVNLGNLSHLMGIPREMTLDEIKETIERFATTAHLAEKAGFDGVEIHAAHGYLVSQFLSPLVNQRKDDYGGSLENRSRFLIEILRSVKKQVSSSFTVGVKLNSADFQKGGFTFEEALSVIEYFQKEGIHFLELSGGSYEAPAMQGESKDGTTLAREAYFLEFAKQVQPKCKVPVMVTGGIKRKEVADEVLRNGIPLVGIATALALNPYLVKDWKSKTSIPKNELPKITWKSKTFKGLANMAMVRYQLQNMAKNKPTNTNISPIWRLIADQMRLGKLTKRYRTWLKFFKHRPKESLVQKLSK